jgi:hypothetical protein
LKIPPSCSTAHDNVQKMHRKRGTSESDIDSISHSLPPARVLDRSPMTVVRDSKFRPPETARSSALRPCPARNSACAHLVVDIHSRGALLRPHQERRMHAGDSWTHARGRGGVLLAGVTVHAGPGPSRAGAGGRTARSVRVPSRWAWREMKGGRDMIGGGGEIWRDRTGSGGGEAGAERGTFIVIPRDVTIY